jgi:hypothetical protein
VNECKPLPEVAGADARASEAAAVTPARERATRFVRSSSGGTAIESPGAAAVAAAPCALAVAAAAAAALASPVSLTAVQGLTLVHYSAQLEMLLTQNTP